MDFRRLGYLSPIIQNLLVDSLAGYLSQGDRAVSADWLNSALEGASHERKWNTRSEPTRIQPGMGAADAYILHDYLASYAQLARKDERIPGDVWEALDNHATNYDDRVRLAWEAVYLDILTG